MGYYDEYLEHHGILGQKWGVRRFEKKNGHLTSAGLKRYEDGRKVTSKEKNAFSAKAAGHKALAKVHEVNEKFYSNKNKTLASANKQAKDQQLKKAEEAQKEANDKKAAKQNDSEAAAKRKKMIVAGAAIAGTALAAYGGYKIHQANQQNKATKQAIDNATKALNDFKAAQSSMNRPNPMKPTSSGSFQNAAPKIDRSTVEHTPIDRIQIDRATVNRVKVDRTPINIDSFNKAAQANDDLVNNLLKKNAKNLGL